MKRIGLYGGSFDPVHSGHVALARTALAHLALDELRWIPAGHAWQKRHEPAPARERVAMIEIAIRDEPRFVVERCELERNGPSYMIDTVRQLKQAGPQDAHWFLIVGQDQYRQLQSWRAWRELLGEVTLAVAGREGVVPTPAAELASQPHDAVALPLPRIDVSSSDIRRRLREGRDIAGMVPAAVAGYIDQHHLYRGNTGS